ncbi:BCCT family transporter [Staphylococcus pseudoxylosus]|uniref:BCCT family transporter n=1 Tax=Staphylococcus pseudoxylosus TaxID=2282419 RepID=UPI002DB6C889|nr:BCCT family transporter [Staphylococcus pseudoxylosus]MEB7754885.1 BCCT family transporter [Staphylococcus pseudoxylosus]
MSKNRNVLYISLILVAIFVIIGVIFSDWLENKTSLFLDIIVNYFNWFYLVVGTFFVAFCLFLMFSKFGNIRLGNDKDQPEYKTLSWIAMLFSAGMGVGLVFWGIAEPISLYSTPITGKGSTVQSANQAMTFSFFHWGLHPWSLFGIVALGLSYFHFRKKLPFAISSLFYPLLGNRIYHPLGKTVDVLSIFITAVGVASTFGLSVIQISNGLNAQWGVPATIPTQLFLIFIATLLFLISSWSGLDRGIKFLSNINMIIMVFLALFLILVGPITQIIEIFFSSISRYITQIIPMSLRLEPFNDKANNWIGNWTIFFWAWWTTWAPFVGSFIARISKGRTIRQFVLGVLLVPSLISFVWFSVLGGSAIHLVHDLGNKALARSVDNNVDRALFDFLSYYPLSNFLSIIALLLIFIFFITSADSATFVLGILSSEGNPNPSSIIKVIWGLLTAGAAIVFLLSGGLDAVQSISIVVAIPFTLISIFICWALFKDLKTETEVSAKEEVESINISSQKSSKIKYKLKSRNNTKLNIFKHFRKNYYLLSDSESREELEIQAKREKELKYND